MGYCDSKEETYFDYKVYTLITFDGFIKTFELTNTPIDDRKAIPDFIENQGKLVILDDKSYISKSLKEELANKGITFRAFPVLIVKNLSYLRYER